MSIQAISTEKSVKLMEAENTIMFLIDRKMNKTELKEELEKLFKVKIEKIRTNIRKGKKIAFVKLKRRIQLWT